MVTNHFFNKYLQKAIMCTCESTPIYMVVEREMEHKGGQRKVHDVLTVATVIRHVLGTVVIATIPM